MKYKIYIGYDPREHLAYDVARHSILSRTDPRLVRITPLDLKELGDILTRPIEKKDGKLWCPISEAPMATEFAISRFCIPFLQKKGWALFVDCDIVCRADIAELFALADDRYAVMCVKHDHKPKTPDQILFEVNGPDVKSVVLEHEETKMDGQVQTYYSRKNWSSVVLWNCEHPSNQALTSEALNTWPGRDLHAFKWLKYEDIGELPQEWNYLVGVTPATELPIKIAHFTLGGPWFKDWKGGPMDDIWMNEARFVQER